MLCVVNKIGRPAKGETREPLTVITFRADAATLDALSKIEATVNADVALRWRRRRRSAAIRRALLETAARLDEGSR